jgi:hypothetical protein
MNWLQIRLFGPYFSSFSTNSYSYYSQMSQNLVSNGQIFASALIVRQAASHFIRGTWKNIEALPQHLHLCIGQKASENDYGDKDNKHNLLWHFLSFSQELELGEHSISAPCPVSTLVFTANNNQDFNQRIEALCF